MVYIRQEARPTLQIKGPKLEGSIENSGVRAGPVSIGLPFVGSFDISAKVQGANVEIMLKIGFLDKPHSQKVVLHMLV